jgi:hypothetical protein
MKTKNFLPVRRLAVCGLLTAVVVIPALADYSATVLAKNPVGYWRFDQTTPPPAAAVATNYGSAGATANGLYVNGVKQLVADAMPATGDTAPAFDGFSQKVEVPFNAALNPGSAFTVEAWVKPTCIDNYDNKWFRASVRSGGGASGGGYQIQYDAGSSTAPGVFKFTLWNTATAGLEVFRQLADPVNILATNNGPWAHLVGTWNSADNIGRIYINGVELTNRTFAYLPNTNAVLRIGAGDPDPVGTDPWGQSFTPGPICKVAVYDTQLSPAQIVAHYTNGLSPSPSPGYAALIAADNPTGYWPLDESTIPSYPVLTNLGSAGAALHGGYGNNLTPAVAGPQPANYGGFESTNLGAFISANGGSAWVPPVNYVTNNLLSIVAWIKRSGDQMAFANIFGRRIPGGEKSAFCFDGNGLNRLAYNWDDNGTQTGFDSKLTVPDGLWTLAAVVFTPSNTTLYMDYGAGLMSATNNFTNVTKLGFSHEILLGPSGPYIGRRFNGSVDEVAVFTNALTAGDLLDLRTAAFGSGLFMAGISEGRPVMLGGIAPFTCLAGAGSDYLPFSYQLLKDGAPVGPPVSSPTITLSNISAADISAAFSIGVITNGGSMVLTSGVTSLKRWTLPGTYSALVESLQPAAYYRYMNCRGRRTRGSTTRPSAPTAPCPSARPDLKPATPATASARAWATSPRARPSSIPTPLPSPPGCIPTMPRATVASTSAAAASMRALASATAATSLM